MITDINKIHPEWFSPDGTFSAKFIEDYNNMNWAENKWFDENYGSTLTSEFKTWWMLNYGMPTDFIGSTPPNSVYWNSCAKLLEAFNAGVKSRREVIRRG